MLMWHYPEKGELPESYCQCLVLYHEDFRLLWFNPHEICWDNERADYFLCECESVKKWAYLSSILDEFILDEFE